MQSSSNEVTSATTSPRELRFGGYQKKQQQQKAEAVVSIMFLKEKNNKYIKIIVCADNINQHETINKEEADSPTVAKYLVFITTLVGAQKC